MRRSRDSFLGNLVRRKVRGALKLHLRLDQRRNVSADFDSVDTLFAMDLEIENAPASHFGSLFADKSRPVCMRDEIMPHHVRSQRPSGAAGCRIFRNSMLRSKHPGISPILCRRKYKDTIRVRIGKLQHRDTAHVEPSPIHCTFTL